MKTAISLLVIILIIPFMVNLPDEKLRDEVEKIINPPPEPITPQPNNGFYGLLGFEAPMGRDIYEAGKEAFAAYSNSQDSKPPQFEFSLEKIIGPSPEMPKPSLIPRCIPEKQECLRSYSEKEKNLVNLLGKNELLLGRYGSLYKYAFFQDTKKSDPWAPPIKLEGAIFSGHLLTAGKAAVLFTKGNHKESLQLLAKDILLWRKLLAGATELPGKTYSLLALRLNYSLLGEMFEKISKDKAAVLIQNELLAPLSIKEKSTDMVWDRNLRALAWSLSNNRWPPDSGRTAKMSFLERAFVKINATLNDAFEMFQLLKKLSTAEPNEIENLLRDYSQRREEISKIGLHTIYNPLGKKFISSAFDEGAGVAWNRNIDSLDQLISRIRDKIQK